MGTFTSLPTSPLPPSPVCLPTLSTPAMVKLIVAGGMGAIINCAYSSAFSLELLFRDFFVQPFSAFRTLLPAVLGFLFGTMILLVWNFMRAMAVRFLLDYNGWFLTPKHPINKACIH